MSTSTISANIIVTDTLSVLGSQSNLNSINVSSNISTSICNISFPVSTYVYKLASGGVSCFGAIGPTQKVVTWGPNDLGQLGLGLTVTSRQTATQITSFTSAIAMATGPETSGVVLSDGSVWIWGGNGSGQLGINASGGSRNTPVKITMFTSATTIGIGAAHTAVVLADGKVWNWGSNSEGQLGIGSFGGSRQTPVQVPGISTASKIACGANHTLVLLTDGLGGYGWGNNNYEQLFVYGGPVYTDSRSTPCFIEANLATNAVAVVTGTYYPWNADALSLFVLVDGSVRTSGDNFFGQANIQYYCSDAVSVATGGEHAIVARSNGYVLSIGNNADGQLGIGVAGGERDTPVEIPGISTAVAVSAGYNSSYVLLSNGTVRAFGSNENGRLAINVNGGSRQTPVQQTTWPSAVTAVVSASPSLSATKLMLGAVPSPSYQLDLSTDWARKLSTSAWATGSDERIKSDIETANVQRCVDIIQNLDLKYFKWNFPDKMVPKDSHSLGWIAQEVEEFLPKSVQISPAHGINDFRNLNSDQIIKVMWGALRKLRADLRARQEVVSGPYPSQ